MFPEIVIDKKNGVPAYRQLIEKITSFIKSGQINPGDKLPPERELAEKLKIARGTIKKAYEELQRDNILEVVQGKGSFVSSSQDAVSGSGMEKAMKIITDAVINLEELHFSSREIGNLIDIKIMERQERLENFNIATIDCNPESLIIYQRQLSFLSRAQITRFLLDELYEDHAPESRLSHFDLILTTATHYTEMLNLVPGLKDKIMQVAVSPSQRSIIDLASISCSQKIGIISHSEKFLQIIKNKLADLRILPANVQHLYSSEEEKFSGFISNKNILIIPPGYVIADAKKRLSSISTFTEKGGRIIQFDFQIERGSLLYVEERVKSLLNK